TQRNYKKAILEYQKAVELDLDNVSAYFNLNLALRKIMEFDDANVAMEKAKKLDKDLVQFNDSLKIPNQNENIRLIPQELSFKELWDKVNTSNKDKVWFFTDKLWGNLIKGISHEFVPFFFPIIIITTLLTYFVRRNFTIPQNCEHCGETFCSRCKTGKEKKELCLKCTQLTSKGSSVSPELRITKIAQVRKFEKMENLKIKILSFLIPGCGHLYAGKTYYGILFLVFWIGISSIIITGIDIIKYPWNIHMSKILWIIYLPFAAIAISFYFFVNFFSIKLLDQEGP
ncbi:tetratricopeptide repeat protein, partial [bacterium]|nr:tetratricopeptide repeat protein [bacterium]